MGETTEYARESRHQRVAPHLGRVELATTYRGELSRPLPGVLDATSGAGSSDWIDDCRESVLNRYKMVKRQTLKPSVSFNRKKTCLIKRA
jgi:hypothetical protein